MFYDPYIPKTVGEIVDHLSMMMLKSPTFRDDYFVGRNVETVFRALNDGLGHVRKRLGEEKYEALLELSNRMRAHFEADPEDKTGDCKKGCELILEMQALLKQPRLKIVR